MGDESDKSRRRRGAILANDASEAFPHQVVISGSRDTSHADTRARRSQSYFAKYGEPLNYPVDAAAWAIGIGRSTLWEMIKRGHIQTVKIGRRRLISKEEVHRIRSGIPQCMNGDC